MQNKEKLQNFPHMLAYVEFFLYLCSRNFHAHICTYITHVRTRQNARQSIIENFKIHNMAEKLVIQNFGALKEAKLNDIGQVLFLIGESGSGKSTILKVLSMCRWIYKQQNIYSYLELKY